MDSETVLDMMRQLGFSDYEAKCYLALFERRSLSANEIAKLSGIPRPSAYDVLDKLMAKGLVAAVSGDKKRYAVSSPKLLREASLNSLESEIRELDRKRERITKRKTSILDDIDTIINELEPHYNENRNNSNPLEYIEILKNPNQIHRKFIELYSNVQKEVLGFTKPPFTYLTKEQMEEQRKEQIKASKRKIIQRGVVQMPNDDLIIQYNDNGLSIPEKNIKGRERNIVTRFVDELPVKLFVFDEKNCFFALEDPIKTKTSLTMLVAKHEAMAKSFKLLFESVWEKAKDYFVVENKKYYLYEPEDEEDKPSNEV